MLSLHSSLCADRGPVGALLLLGCLLVGIASPLAAQDVAEIYKKQRERARVIEVLEANGPDAIPKAIEEHAPYRDEVTGWLEVERLARAQRVADSLAAIRDSVAALPPLAEVHLRKVQPDEQGAFLERYQEAYWVSSAEISSIDSLATLFLRGRMARLYGAPTRNAAAVEQEQYGGSEFVQFEYWFVVNDSIPVMVLDRNGPEGMGLLVAGDRQHREALEYVEEVLAEELISSNAVTAFVDYYQSRNSRQWYRAGYDGSEFFVNPIRRPRWARRIPPAEQRNKWTIHR